MAAHLKQHGWQYIVVDFIWSSPKLEPMFAPSQDDKFSPRLTMDEHGRLLPEPNRFPFAANGMGFKPLADYVHGKYLALFNACDAIPEQKNVAAKEVKVTFKDLGLGDKCAVRDLWQKKDAGKFQNAYSVIIPWHGAALYRVTAK